MSKTAFVAYGDVGFWAYDVGLGIFLKFLIDRAILRTSKLESRGSQEGVVDPEQAIWLSSCIDGWRLSAVQGGNFGLTFDYPMPEEQIQVIDQLIEEACRELGSRESILGQEMGSWDVLDGEGIFSRGHAVFPTEPLVALGRAIQDLLRGTLLQAPKGKLWYYGTPAGRGTIDMRFTDPERPEGINIKVNSRLDVEESFLVAGDTNMKTGQVNHILKFLTNDVRHPKGSGRIQLSPAQVEAIFALLQETKIGLSLPDRDPVAPASDMTTVTIKQGPCRLELEYRSEAPKEWKQIEELVKLVRRLADEASGVELD